MKWEKMAGSDLRNPWIRKWGLRDLVIGMRGSADLWYYCVSWKGENGRGEEEEDWIHGWFRLPSCSCFPLVIGCLLLCKWRLTLDLDLYKSYEQAGSH